MKTLLIPIVLLALVTAVAAQDYALVIYKHDGSGILYRRAAGGLEPVTVLRLSGADLVNARAAMGDGKIPEGVFTARADDSLRIDLPGECVLFRSDSAGTAGIPLRKRDYDRLAALLPCFGGTLAVAILPCRLGALKTHPDDLAPLDVRPSEEQIAAMDLVGPLFKPIIRGIRRGDFPSTEDYARCAGRLLITGNRVILVERESAFSSAADEGPED